MCGVIRLDGWDVEWQPMNERLFVASEQLFTNILRSLNVDNILDGINKFLLELSKVRLNLLSSRKNKGGIFGSVHAIELKLQN